MTECQGRPTFEDLENEMEKYFHSGHDEAAAFFTAAAAASAAAAALDSRRSRPTPVLLSSDEETASLSKALGEYLSSMSARQGSQYQCMLCSSVQRDLFNMRNHLMGHMTEDAPLTKRLDATMAPHILRQSNMAWSCFLCKKVIKRRYKEVRAHFVVKHLNCS